MSPIDRQATFSGTRSVAPALQFDADRLAAYLAEHLPPVGRPLHVRQFKGGQSNPTYRLDTPSRRYVLRRKPPGKLLPSAHAVDREFRVIDALSRQKFPVAHAYALCTDDSIIGAAFYIMSMEEGRVFWDPTLPSQTPADRRNIFVSKIETLAHLHNFDPEKIGLADFGRGENYVGRQVERWSKQYRASETEKIDDMERLIEWLPAHLPPSPAVRIVHGDYRLDNLILDAGAPQVRAVLDWELSTLGDPLADFSYHLMAWHMPQSDSAAGTASLVGHDLAALGIPSMDDYADSYRRRTGLDPRPLLPVYLAYNFFRLAAILQGIIGRVRDGTATSEFAPTRAALIRPLAEKAWEFAQRA
jgi:aminoglycoside phosphotransferase (APT) family kinase protein